MPDARRSTVLAAIAIAAVMAIWVAPSEARAQNVVTVSEPDSSIDAPIATSPEPTSPEPTPTTSEPTSATSEPDESTPTPSPDDLQDDSLIGAGDPDSDVDGTTSTLAVVGFVLMIALAGWWMVRRSNPDAEPMPRPPSERPSDII